MIGPLVNHFPKQNRLLKKNEFDTVFSEGVRVHTRRFVFVVRENPRGHDRLGLIVSKKVGNAVARNRVKRCLRESFRQKPTHQKSLEIVVIAKREAASSGYTSFVDDLRYGIRKASQKLVSA